VTFLIWSLAAIVASAYCIGHAFIDFKRRRFVWAMVGLVSAMVFLLTPIQTHAVKVDLPIAPAAR
jgi:hypothetical protein